LETGNWAALTEKLVSLYQENEFDPRTDFLISQLEEQLSLAGKLDQFPKTLHRISKFGEQATTHPIEECYKAILTQG